MTSFDLQGQWPFCRIELGLSRAEFDRLTPREFVEMIDLWKQREERLDRRTARLCLAISLTIPRRDGAELPTEETFMPKPKEEIPQPVQLSDEELQRIFESITR